MPYSILSSINADIGWYNPISCLVGTAELTYMTLTGPSPYISWVSISRTLALSFSYTIVGRLSDLYGRRWFHIGGNIVSLVGIIMCAVAQNVGTLIGGCTVYGLGEVVQLTFTVALGELVPNKHRPTISSFIFLTNAPFATFGPVIGTCSPTGRSPFGLVQQHP
jgi:MFS family permease